MSRFVVLIPIKRDGGGGGGSLILHDINHLKERSYRGRQSLREKAAELVENKNVNKGSGVIWLSAVRLAIVCGRDEALLPGPLTSPRMFPLI